MTDNEIEEWRPVAGHEGAYEVSSLGQVRSLSRFVGSISRLGNTYFRAIAGTLLKPNDNSKGYLSVQLGNRERRLLHRIVAIAFIPNPQNLPQVNHKDADKTNCRKDNLEWMTNKENQEHGTRLGLMPRALANGNGKLSDDEVREIRSRLGYRNMAALGREYGVSQTLIWRIAHGLNRADVV